MKYNVQVPLFIRAEEDVDSYFARTCETEQKQIEGFFCLFGGLECVGHSFAYVAHFVFWRDV
jgi:hypothetical protein